MGDIFLQCEMPKVKRKKGFGRFPAVLMTMLPLENLNDYQVFQEGSSDWEPLVDESALNFSTASQDLQTI